jgi:hypothetical protein
MSRSGEVTMILRQSPNRHAPVLAAGILAMLAAAVVSTRAAAASLVGIEVYDRSSGQSLDQHRFRWQRYIAGEPGHEYSIRLRNRSAARVLAVVSVDGINVISGETASPGQSGYVIEAGESVEIQGWRKDLERTAAFYFTDIADAYAARTGRPENIGVIGVAAFRERPQIAVAEVDRSPAETDAGVAKSASGDARAPSTTVQGSSAEARRESSQRADAGPLGTGHGRREYSPARRVEFERRSPDPDEVTTIRYDSVERLVARGVLPRPRPSWSDPDPFPALTGFVADP